MSSPTPTLPKGEGAKTDYSITEVCPHDITFIRVIESIATCETTVEVCENCGEIVTEPKTEC